MFILLFHFSLCNLPCIYFRVTCFGPATIVEVAYQSKAISEKKENVDDISKQHESEIEEIKSAKKSLEKQKTVLEEKIALLNKEKKLLENFSACVSAVSLSIQLPFSSSLEQLSGLEGKGYVMGESFPYFLVVYVLMKSCIGKMKT